MPGIEPFSLYRRALFLVGATYTLVRLIQFIWHWRAAGLTAGRHELLLRRWVVFSLLRIRVRRFTFDLAQIVGLTAILAYLVWRQL